MFEYVLVWHWNWTLLHIYLLAYQTITKSKLNYSFIRPFPWTILILSNSYGTIDKHIRASHFKLKGHMNLRPYYLLLSKNPLVVVHHNNHRSNDFAIPCQYSLTTKDNTNQFWSSKTLLFFVLSIQEIVCTRFWVWPEITFSPPQKQKGQLTFPCMTPVHLHSWDTVFLRYAIWPLLISNDAWGFHQHAMIITKVTTIINNKKLLSSK